MKQASFKYEFWRMKARYEEKCYEEEKSVWIERRHQTDLRLVTAAISWQETEIVSAAEI